jgi:hypothetical protein
MLMASGVGICTNAFHRRQALPGSGVVLGEVLCEHFAYECRDTPLFLCRQRPQGFVLPVFEDNMRLMHRSLFPT